MNSLEEKELFESHSWEYNYVKREWTSPSGIVITQNQLMEYTTNPKGEADLVVFVKKYGKPRF